MTEAEFERIYQATIDVIEETLEVFIDDSDIDVDYETVNGILTLDCGNGGSIIITPQGATSQLWIAAKSGGYHFAWDEAEEIWQSTITGQALGELLSENIKAQAGDSPEFPTL